MLSWVGGKCLASLCLSSFDIYGISGGFGAVRLRGLSVDILYAFGGSGQTVLISSPSKLASVKF